MSSFFPKKTRKAVWDKLLCCDLHSLHFISAIRHVRQQYYINKILRVWVWYCPVSNWLLCSLFPFHRFTCDLSSWHKKLVWKLSGQATRCSESSESHRIPAAYISLVLVMKANVEGEHTKMLADCYLYVTWKLLGFFSPFGKALAEAMDFWMYMFIIHCRLPVSEIRLPVTAFILSLVEDKYRSQACWRGSTFLCCKILWCICAGPLRQCFQKWFKLV